jgi:hypothetical protein
MNYETEIHVISLGAGVQSSTMALMAACGEIEPMPVGAIFADTQAEPASVYKWLDWLEKQLPFPVYRVTAGSLAEDALKVRRRKDGLGNWVRSGIPAYLINADGSHGQIPRQCTQDFKIIPIQRQIRKLLKECGAKKAIQWIGISLDEVHRMKPSRVRYSEHRWPLIEGRMTRGGCLIWMDRHGYPKPARSACVFCPYHSNTEWRRLRDEEPEEFQKAVKFERAFAQAKKTTVMKTIDLYVHSDRVPLDEVNLSTDEERGQMSLFGNECEGMCGV